mmetsp:Transcript_43255/g.117094  ORF Transcript_43255/g.117094 Transcript_43255/m.117094 type:complete len:221 (-) Transcript_43255:1356-2018(-)
MAFLQPILAIRTIEVCITRMVSIKRWCSRLAACTCRESSHSGAGRETLAGRDFTKVMACLTWPCSRPGFRALSTAVKVLSCHSVQGRIGMNCSRQRGPFCRLILVWRDLQGRGSSRCCQSFPCWSRKSLPTHDSLTRRHERHALSHTDAHHTHSLRMHPHHRIPTGCFYRTSNTQGEWDLYTYVVGPVLNCQYLIRIPLTIIDWNISFPGLPQVLLRRAP